MDNEVGVSRKAAFQGIRAVEISRVAMAVPGMGSYSRNNNSILLVEPHSVQP